MTRHPGEILFPAFNAPAADAFGAGAPGFALKLGALSARGNRLGSVGGSPVPACAAHEAERDISGRAQRSAENDEQEDRHADDHSNRQSGKYWSHEEKLKALTV